MSSGETQVNIARLLTRFNIEIKELPDKLKCAQCKSVLKDACQVPCGCQFCRTCVDDLILRVGQFCPGDSQDCGMTSLSTAAPDFRANKSIMKLTAKCPHSDCTHECPLADMEGHLRVCPRKSVDCPFRELGCLHGELTAADMSGHMQQESGRHNEILIGLVSGIKSDMEMLNQQLILKNKQEILLENELNSVKEENISILSLNKSFKEDIKSISVENKSIMDEIKSIKNEYKSMKAENKSIREENESIKDKIKLIIDENKLIKEENKSIKNDNKSIRKENKSIKREKEALSERVQQLAENLERERDERANARISVVASNCDALSTDIEPVRGDIRSIKEQLDSIRCHMGSLQIAVGLGQLYDWVIDEDVSKIEWGWVNDIKTSGKFRSEGRPLTHELGSQNAIVTGLDKEVGELLIQWRLWAGPSDDQIEWLFRTEITITVAQKDNAEKCVRQTQQCLISRPERDCYSRSEPIIFEHAALRGAGLDLKCGLRVSCQIVPVTGH